VNSRDRDPKSARKVFLDATSTPVFFQYVIGIRLGVSNV
jgi:hypothetical protein